MEKVRESAPVFVLSVKANERVLSEETLNKILKSRQAAITHDFELLRTGQFKPTSKWFTEQNLSENGLNYTTIETETGKRTVLIVCTEEVAISLKGIKGETKAEVFSSNVLQNFLAEEKLISLEPVEYEVKRGKEIGTMKEGVQPVNFKLVEFTPDFAIPEGVIKCFYFEVDKKAESVETESTESETKEVETVDK